MTAPLFEIEGLRAVTADGGVDILKGIDLTVAEGEVHALMGPNGSGKSTLASVLLGSPEYEVTGGSIKFRGEDITEWDPDIRGKAGIFLAFQYPQEIPGVSVINFLRQALSARKGIDLSVLELRLAIMEWMERLEMDPSFGERYLNEGFSGGEKKRNEILQMAILEPEMAILDETDSGLDIDALRVVAKGHPRGSRGSARDGRARHHPLSTTSRRTAARQGPHHRRRHDHQSGAWRPPRNSSGTGYESFRFGGVTAMTPTAVARRHQAGLPRPSAAGARQAADLSRLGNTSQKPQPVIDAMADFYATTNAQRSTAAPTTSPPPPRRSRELAPRSPLHQRRPSRGGRVHPNATEALNLLARSWGRRQPLRPGDAVVLSHMEHHANIVPWQMLSDEIGIELRFIPVTR